MLDLTAKATLSQEPFKLTCGITFGTWDMLHAGHLLFLEECKNNCSWLVVGLHVDPAIERPRKNSPIETLYERYLRLYHCEYVDQIIPYQTEDEVVDILKTQQNSSKKLLRFLGSDYSKDCDKNKDVSFTGIDLNIDTCFINRDHNYSSSRYHKLMKYGI